MCGAVILARAYYGMSSHVLNSSKNCYIHSNHVLKIVEVFKTDSYSYLTKFYSSQNLVTCLTCDISLMMNYVINGMQLICDLPCKLNLIVSLITLLPLLSPQIVNGILGKF